VLYGGAEQVHFSSPMILFRTILNTPDVYEVTLNIEGTEHSAILQDVQFHPVNDIIMHADFLEITPDKVIKIDVPVKLIGTAVGQTKGGKLNLKLRKLTLQGPAKNIPDYVEVNVKDLDLGKSVKVAVVNVEGCKVLNAPSNPIASIEIPRALRSQMLGK
jgi:large subunit ribosomal protein L25